jgi:hypothetical protein
MKSKDLHSLPDEALIKAHLQAAESDAAKGSLGTTEAGRVMLEGSADRKSAISALALELWINESFYDAGKVASALLRTNPKEWTASHLVPVVNAASKLNREHQQFGWFQGFPHKPLITAVEKAAASEPLSMEFRGALERWKAAVMPRPLTAGEHRELGEAQRVAMDESEGRPWSVTSAAFEAMERLKRITIPLAEERKLIERLAAVLAAAEGPTGGHPVVHIDTTDAVGIKLAADVAKGGRASGRAWTDLLQFSRTLSATTPPSKWLVAAAEKVSVLKPEEFAACVADWLNEGGKAAPQKLVSSREVSDATLFNDCSIETLKGLAWAAVAAGRTELAPALGNLAEACFKKVPDIGPRNVKLGNAAVSALAAFEKPEAATQLSRLRLKVRHPSSRATIDKALAALSRKTGIAPDDLAEMSVPAFGLDKEGKRPVKVGDCVGELAVVDSGTVQLNWKNADGTPCDSVPVVVRKSFGEQLKQLKREAKDASTILAAQSLRLERSFLSDRNWPFGTWQERFLKHPLTGTVARRLIWQFEDTPAVPLEGDLVTVTGRKLSPKKNDVVSLWHPILSKPQEVLAWRNWLEQHELTQPFKQAHREIYVLTDAERRTKSYSNRFAAHILRQHQFAALCQQRGWDYRVQGKFDSHNTPTLNLPAQGLRAEFWVEAVQGQLSPQMIYLYVATDQVRFGPPLEEVPPVVFSEIMRDIDLFVGVASVANDPTWSDTGPSGDLRIYWDTWSFGDLSESALTRKQVLERLIPKLRIAGQCSVQDKYLVVKGSLRTYKIHLGSGNIRMEPNDQFLCIVPLPSELFSQTGRVFLPFEGDSTLSVILSKAFLLAEDSKIKDETITRQIRS